MPRRLRAPTDLTAPADRAVRYAADLAETIGAELGLVQTSLDALLVAVGVEGCLTLRVPAR